MAKRKNTKRYSSAEKKAYWMGVGESFAHNNQNSQAMFKNFESNCSKEEWDAYNRGFNRAESRPYIYYSKKRKK